MTWQWDELVLKRDELAFILHWDELDLHWVELVIDWDEMAIHIG